MNWRGNVDQEVLAERNRCAEIFRDAAEKLACSMAAKGELPVSEITPRVNKTRDEFLRMAREAFETARKADAHDAR